MKRIVLSFDDSRADFYNRVFPLLRKYKFKATLNVITGFVNRPQLFPTLLPFGAMSPSQIKECFDSGIEIACHGDMHISDSNDLMKNIQELRNIGINGPLGFASPFSELTYENKDENGVWQLYMNNTVSYVRSGFVVRREGLIYIALTVLNMMFHLPLLYRSLNKKAIFTTVKDKILPSATIFSYTTNKEVENFIDSIPDNASVIFMFHSVLSKEDNQYGKGKWFWDVDRFESLLKWLSNQDNINVCTTLSLVETFHLANRNL